MQTQSPPFLKHLHRIIGQQSSGISDAQLLERFVGQRDEAAFELLLWRHERLVLSVCRWVLGHEQDAEDAFQATFLTLACKAGSIGKGQALASWLYKVAFRISLRARSRVVKKDRLEQRAEDWLLERAGSEPYADVAVHDLQRVICEEVHRLPEKYQAPVVLCYLEGKTNEEAARQLCCPTGTVVTRLARARKRLRDRLCRRGVEVSSGGLAVSWFHVVTPSSARAALLDKTLKAALHFAIHKGAAPGLVSAKVAALTKGALKAMLMTKLKLLTATLLALTLLGTGSAVMAFRSHAADPAQKEDKDSEQSEDTRAQDKESRKSEKQKERKPQKSKEWAEVKEVVTKSFKTGRSPRLVVEMFNGAIDVVAKGDRTVDVRVTKRGHGKTQELAQQGLANVEVEMSQDGDTVHVVARKKEEKDKESNSGASAELEVPAGAVLDLRTGNGAVSVTGGSGEKKIHTSNGAIRVKGNTAAVELVTSNGPITVEGGKGQIKLRTSNGRIDIQTDKSEVIARTSNGSVRFKGSLAAGQHSFHTSNGTVSLALPADAKFRVQAHTSHGQITSDFFTVKRSRGTARAEAEVGENPKVTISVESSNGNVDIRKATKSEDKEPEMKSKERKKSPRKAKDKSDDDEDSE
jgi:RNA polymerase sigma factor (sigma-70 family)